MPIAGPEDKNGDIFCGEPDAPKPVMGPEDTKGVVAREGPDASMPPTGPGDLKGVEDCGAARNGEVGLPGKFACSFPLGCIFT